MNREDGGREGGAEGSASTRIPRQHDSGRIWRSYPAHSIGEWAMLILFVFGCFRGVHVYIYFFLSLTPGYQNTEDEEENA